MIGLWRGVLLCALLAQAGPAFAVEILKTSKQVNPKADAEGAIYESLLVEDVKGGVGAIWSKKIGGGSNPLPEQVFIRYLNAELAPATAPARIDGPVAGFDMEYVFLENAMALKGRSAALVGWLAQYAARNKDFVGRIVRKGAPKDDVFEFDDTSSTMLFTELVPLRDGRGLALFSSNFNTAVGRLIEPTGEIGPVTVDFSIPEGSYSRATALDEGFAGAFARFPESGFLELYVQIFDADGAKEGEPFVVIPKTNTLPPFTFFGPAKGKVGLFRYIQKEGGKGDVTMQLFSRAGKKLGRPKALLRNVLFQSNFAAAALPEGGFVMAVEDGEPVFGAPRQVLYVRFDAKLKRVGKVARTKLIDGLRRERIRLLGNGKVAASYTVKGRKLFVDLLQP